MITIADILLPRHIELDLKTVNQEEAINQIASLLREDDRVKDWNEFYKGLGSKQPCVAASGETDICIPHTRTNSVSSMVMAAGRSTKGITIKGVDAPIHFVFVIGVPTALASDYLRIIGALARIFKDDAAKEKLRAAKTAEEFVQLLGSAEMKL
jgi:fructose PTS system EIIBC or EIIC component